MNNLNKKNQEEKNKGLTIEKLKKYQGFENLSDEEVKELIQNIDQLALVFYDYFKEAFNTKNE
ncbi:MAG: hypothetical protein MJA84_14365 [Firmicutes bacterium]|nr:hypothetical protein [Bacillota bacterium]